MDYKIEQIEGIGPVYAAKLVEAGIKTGPGTLHLRARGLAPKCPGYSLAKLRPKIVVLQLAIAFPGPEKESVHGCDK
jgi:hypothetical protein